MSAKIWYDVDFLFKTISVVLGFSCFHKSYGMILSVTCKSDVGQNYINHLDLHSNIKRLEKSVALFGTEVTGCKLPEVGARN